MEMNPIHLVIIVFFLLGIGWLIHLRTKSGFRYLKSKFGKKIDNIYGYPSIDKFITDFTTKTKYWFYVKDSTIIDIDDKIFPLIFGGVIYPNYHHTLRSATNAYYLITDEKNRYVLDEKPDLFKFADSDGKYFVYWATNIKGLIALKNSIG